MTYALLNTPVLLTASLLLVRTAADMRFADSRLLTHSSYCFFP